MHHINTVQSPCTIIGFSSLYIVDLDPCEMQLSSSSKLDLNKKKYPNSWLSCILFLCKKPTIFPQIISWSQMKPRLKLFPGQLILLIQAISAHLIFEGSRVLFHSLIYRSLNSNYSL